MRMLVWNINALVPTVRNAVLKHGSWLAFFEHHGLDLLCIQETKIVDDKLTAELCCCGDYQSFWAVSREKRGYSGVATYASAAWAPVSAEADCLGSGEDDLDREGRVVITDHGAFVLVNVYGPNAGDRPERPRLQYKLRFLAALKAKLDALTAAGREVILVGDLNIPAEPRDMHPALGPYSESYGEEERAALAGLMASYPDVWRRLHPEESSTFTVWDEKKSNRAFNHGLRIDYVLMSPGLLDRVVSCEVLSTDALPPKWSDHAGILLELRDVPPLPPHPPCKAWAMLHRRFNDPTQPSILSMFGKKRPAATGGGSEQQQQQQQQQPADKKPADKKARHEAAAAEAEPASGSQPVADRETPAAADAKQPSKTGSGSSKGKQGKGSGSKGKQAPPPSGQRGIGAFFKAAGSQ